MKKRFVIPPIVVFLVIVVGSYLFIRNVQSQLAAIPIKTLAEEQIGTFLGMKVSIQKVQFGLLRPVSLSGLKFQPEGPAVPNIDLASVKRITLRYNLLNLFQKDFRNPNRVILESPMILFRNLQIPAKLFQKKTAGENALFLTRQFQLAIKGGTVDYPLGGDYKVSLRDINGVFLPQGRDGIKVKLDAKGAGIFRGHMVVSGQIFPSQESYDLELHFRRGGEIFLPGFLKLKDVSGTFHIQPNKITFEHIRFRVTDLLFEAQGTILDYEGPKPIMSFVFKLLLGKTPIQTKVDLNFKEEKVSGLVDFFNEPFPFEGKLFTEGSALKVSKMQVLGDYLFSGSFDVLKNQFQLNLNREPFRLTTNFSFDNWDIAASVNLEHVMIQESDLVAYLSLRLTPTPAFKKEKKLEMIGHLKTDYLILDTEPLNDLNGTFRLEGLELKDMNLKWGREFRLIGHYNLASPKETEFALELNNVALENLKRLFLYRRPKAFGGEANGKIEMTGGFQNPLISGTIEIAHGVVGNLQYKNAYLKFSGYYPYLRLINSQISKGKSRFHLRGDLNLRAANVFQDLEVLSEEQIVVWRGVILSENLDENLVMIGDRLKRKLLEP